MSREKQIEEMAKDICRSEILCHTCGESTYTYCAEAIAEALYNAGYRKQEWISVDERLPQKHDEVLVFCDGARQLDFICSSGRWYDHDHKKVTHWMPLPEAPKMKGGAE